MKLRNLIILLILVMTMAVLAACGRRSSSALAPVPTANVPPVPTLDATQAALGQTLYLEHCAACHGINGEGQPNWKQKKPDGSFPAPPHDNSGHTWHHPDDVLTNIIANGQQGFAQSQMPQYRDVLSEAEMQAVVGYMKTWWGVDERSFQWQVTWQARQ